MNFKSMIALILSIGLISNILFSGDITGFVRIKTPPRKIQRFNPYTFKETNKSKSTESPVENVVIYIDAPNLHLFSLKSSEGNQIIQKKETFIPHVLPIVVGSTVDFPNLDPFYHNVFSLAKIKKFDLGRYPTGKSKKVKFDKPGIVKIFCEIHSDMKAIIVVLENPFFTKPDKNGKYMIKDVPSGTYRLVAWHESLEPIAKQVNIPLSGIVNVNFVFE